MPDLRTTPPLPMAQVKKVKRPEKLSQSALSHFDTCPRSALLYWKHKGGPQSAAMVRGSVFHRFVENAVEQIRDEAQHDPMARQMPPEVAKDQIMALIESGELVDLDDRGEERRLVFHLPEYEQNALRAMAWHWAEATIIDPEEIVGLEQMIELELAGHTIRGKLDFAEIGPVQGALIRDYKTSINIPSKDEIEHGAKSFQGKFYALLLMFGIPEGDSFPLGKGLDEVRVELSYPRYTDSETGSLIGREVVWTRDQLVDFKRTIEGHIEAIDRGFETGNFPALAGAWCSECPARAECPIPEQYHEIKKIETVEEAVAALEVHFTRDAEQRKIMRSVSAFHEDYGRPLVMGDYVYDRRLEVRRSVDWDAAGDDPVTATSDVVKVTRSTPFRKRKIKPEEREELEDAA